MRYINKLVVAMMLLPLFSCAFATEKMCVAPATLASSQYDVSPDEDKKPCLNRQINKAADSVITEIRSKHMTDGESAQKNDRTLRYRATISSRTSRLLRFGVSQ